MLSVHPSGTGKGEGIIHFQQNNDIDKNSFTNVKRRVHVKRGYNPHGFNQYGNRGAVLNNASLVQVSNEGLGSKDSFKSVNRGQNR